MFIRGTKKENLIRERNFTIIQSEVELQQSWVFTIQGGVTKVISVKEASMAEQTKSFVNL